MRVYIQREAHGLGRTCMRRGSRSFDDAPCANRRAAAMTQPVAVPLRIVVDQPIPGLALALQCGKDRLQPPAFASAERVIFDLALRLGSPNPDGSPNLLGPCVQGTPTARFVYLCVGRHAGQAASTTD